jgi:hypothetical protein
LQEAVADSRERAKQVKEEGVDQTALDAAAAKGLGNALFEYDEDEVTQVVEEFYPPEPESLPNNYPTVSKLREELRTTGSTAQ